MIAFFARAVVAVGMAGLCVASVGCSKTETSSVPEPAASSSGARAPSGSAPASASAATTADGGSTTGGGATPAGGSASNWAGSYESAAGTLYVPSGKEWEGVKFRGEKSEAALGKGDLQIAVDARGSATGTVEGPLGPGVVSGSMQGDTFTARFSPKDPAGMGFTGTLVGAAAQGAITGKLFASQAEARLIREASFVLKRK